MKRKHLHDLLNLYQKDLERSLWGFDQEQKKTLDRFQSFLDSNTAVFERTYFPGHFTGSGFLLSLDLSSVLMTHHKKLNKWLQLGGHADGDPYLDAVAFRECFEESGIEQLRFMPHPLSKTSPWIFDLDDHEIPERGSEPFHTHYDARFILIADQKEFKVSDESIDLKWIPLDEVESYNNEFSIVRCIKKIQNILSYST